MPSGEPRRGIGLGFLLAVVILTVPLGSDLAHAEVKVLKGRAAGQPAEPSPAQSASARIVNAPDIAGLVEADGSTFWIADPEAARRLDCIVGDVLPTGQREIACTARPLAGQEPPIVPTP